MVTRFQRYRQIADAGQYGFGILVEEVIPGQGGCGAPETAPEGRSVYERIRLAIEELGPTYIKFGQIMSTVGNSSRLNSSRNCRGCRTRLPHFPLKRSDR